MKTLLLAASALLAAPDVAYATTPTAFIDLHLVTSFVSTGSIESGYEFRVQASEASFGGDLPKAPQWATNSPLSSGSSGGTEQDNLKSKTSNRKSSYPSHRLMFPPETDEFLCNEAKGVSDYKNPKGNEAAGIFDPDTQLTGFEGQYILVSRGHCNFAAKARSAQRLGASGVIIRNTLDSRYGLEDEDASTNNRSGGPDWDNTKWPVEQRDYECGTNKAANDVGWRAEIETSKLDFNPAPYDGDQNNVLLTGTAVDGNLCAKQAIVDSFGNKCPSTRCLLTGRNARDDGSILEACCAWDQPSFYRDSVGFGEDDGDAVPEEEEEEITIPALYVTMKSGEELYDLMVDAEQNSGGQSVQFLNIVPYARWYPSMHFSNVLLFVLALFTLWISAYESASEYRTSWKKISQAVNDGVLVFQRSATNSNHTDRERAETEDTVDDYEDNMELDVAPEIEMTGQNGSAGTGQNDVPPSPIDSQFSISDEGANEDDFVGSPTSPSPKRDDAGETSPDNEETPSTPREDEEEPQSPTTPTDSDTAAASAEQQPQQVNLQSRSTASPAESFGLTVFHSIFIVLLATGFLMLLFFFNLGKVIRVIYGLGGSVAMNLVLVKPLYAKVTSKFLGDKVSKKMQSIAFGDLPGCRGEYFKWIDVASSTTSFALAIAWIIVGLTLVQPMHNVYYWLIQDVMGVCFCILILGLIHVNTIMVASILLCLVFVYDVFHVFISPYIFGSSVMIDVAEGDTVDLTYCEKYPDDRTCRGGKAPLPMLLAVPWFNDFRGGFSMIGLGDIILPGLLISFAARYDAARALVRKCSQTSSIRSGVNAADAGEGEADVSSGSKRYHYHLGRVFKALFEGYFGPLMIAYAVGLSAAFIAVAAMQQGQPALLYLVPTCLGTTLLLGWRRRELSELWSGPKILMKANRMIAVAGRIPEARAAAATAASNNLAETSTVV